MMNRVLVLFWFLSMGSVTAQGDLDALIQEEMEGLLATYRWFHANPELSLMEKATSKRLAEELRAMGFAVTEQVGSYGDSGHTAYGVVGVMENGEGPAVLVRTDLDALPLAERTGLPYASTLRVKDGEGNEVGVMHACGHDVHMTSFLGAAKVLARLDEAWKGTLVLVGQPAEETGQGSRALLADGLYERFPRPDFAIALHDDPLLEAGKVGICEGYTLAAVTSVDITVFGAGGHGAAPHEARDPIVLASQVVLALQTIVSRELSPMDPAVITVGAIHGGSKRNIIPDEVKLKLTVRTYKESVLETILAAMERITRGIALGAGVPEGRLPRVEVLGSQSTPSMYNDPPLTRRLASVWRKTLGTENVVGKDPVMMGEDFSRYGLEGRRIPACLFWLGAGDPEKLAESRRTGESLPPLHSPFFAPAAEPTIRTGVKATISAVLELMED